MLGETSRNTTSSIKFSLGIEVRSITPAADSDITSAPRSLDEVRTFFNEDQRWEVSLNLFTVIAITHVWERMCFFKRAVVNGKCAKGIRLQLLTSQPHSLSYCALSLVCLYIKIG